MIASVSPPEPDADEALTLAQHVERIERGIYRHGWACPNYQIAEAHASVAALAARLAAAEEARDALDECDCVYSPVSSKSCPKCGRRGVVSQEFWLKIVERANQTEAAVDESARLREALSWALDCLELALRRIDTVDGPPDPESEHARLRAAGLAKARAALAVRPVVPADGKETGVTYYKDPPAPIPIRHGCMNCARPLDEHVGDALRCPAPGESARV